MLTGVRYRSRALVRSNFVRDNRVRRLLANEHLSPEALKERQAFMLRRTLAWARKRLSAYRELDWPCGDVFGYWQTLPIVSKDDLLASRDQFYPTLGAARCWTARGLTSGTTGTPLDVYRSLDSVLWESAFIARHWRWSGFTGRMKRATLRGDNVVPAGRTSKPFWYFNKAENQLLLSSRHLYPPYIDAIIEELRSFSPYLLQAYPSTAYELALHLEHAGEYLRIPYVYTSSEVLYRHQRELISERLGSRIIDQYGMAERVAFIAGCEEGNYHVNSDYSYVEIVDDDGNPTGGIGYIAGTTFHNATMPLIRYRTSDLTRWRTGACPCGRTYPIVESMEGKFEDTLYGSRGNAVSPSVLTFAFKGLQRIARSQVAQVGESHWEVRVIPFQGFGASERAALQKNIRELVDPGLNVTVVERKELPRTAAGKYRWVVNEYHHLRHRARSRSASAA